jgi:bifunctional enzyme CysN/CysC
VVSDLLRLATAGSVDDGKSTLIGRLLYDSKALMADQLADAEVDLAQLTDGLRAEREQGITIDVAYRFFATPKRSFIIADTPGHVRYTRNMVTGASTADLAVVLIDARNGVLEQSRRHACVSAMLGIRHVVFCVNKMDLVDWDEDRFREIEHDANELAARLEVGDARVIPISALKGDNVVEPSGNAPWYGGAPLLEQLETVEVAADRNVDDVRLPVQWTIRPRGGAADARAYAGQLVSGVLTPGDDVVVLPEGARTTVERIETFDGPVEQAVPPMSISVVLADDLDVGRGDLIARADAAPTVARELEATVCWMSDAPLRPGARLRLKHTTRNVRATVEALLARVDVTTLDEQPDPSELALNDIGRIRILTAGPVLADRYDDNRATGAFILIDEQTRDTVAAGMVRHAREGTAAGLDAERAWTDGALARDTRWEALDTRGATVWLTGAAGAIVPAAEEVERRLVEAGRPAYLLDRRLSGEGLSPGRVARLFADSGAVAIVALPAAAAQVRRLAKELHAAAGLPFLVVDVGDGDGGEDAAARVIDALWGAVAV